MLTGTSRTMIPACIFTYANDSQIVLLAAASAIRAGFGPVFVVDDKNNPSGNQALVARVGAVPIQSEFDRGGNLRGIDCYMGTRLILRRAMKEAGSTHILKMDPDVIINRGGNLQAMAEENCICGGMGFDDQPMIGSAYITSLELTEKTLSFIGRWGGVPGLANKGLYEDTATAWMGKLMAPGRYMVQQYRPGGGLCAGWQFSGSLEKMEYYLDKFDVISFTARAIGDRQITNADRLRDMVVMDDLLCRKEASHAS